MTEKFELSRRKALLGLGTIGAAGAAAGYGTSALFSDEEEFEDNTITAGTLDMAVTGEIVAANQEYIDEVADITGNPIEADGEVQVGFQVEDFKPGDWFVLCMTVDSVADNPFYVTLHAEELTEGGGDNPEPEGPNNKNLGQKVLASYWENWDKDVGGKDGLSGLDNITNTQSNQFYSGSYLEPDEDGNTSDSSVGYTDVREFFYGLDQDPANTADDNDPLGNGFASGDGILVGGTSNPVRVGRTDNTGRRRLSDPDGDGESELVFYLLFELPSEVGNEIQGDTLSGDLRINAEQVRNNDDARSGRTNSTS